MTRTQLVKKLDRVFSRWVRLSRANIDGLVECVTCRKWKHWKEIHAGHYISRRHMSVRFDPQNVHPQCAGCNSFNAGAMDEYALYLRKEYGETILEDLHARKHKLRKWDTSELLARIEAYTDAADSLERQKA